MIISHKHKFIFIKTAKTAGTAIELALSKICGEKDIITPSTDRNNDIKYKFEQSKPRNYNYKLGDYIPLDYLRFLKRLKQVGFTEHIGAREIKKHIPNDVWNNYYKFCFERDPWEKMVSWYYYYGKGKSAKSIKEFIKSGKAGKLAGFDLYSINGWPVVNKIYKLENVDDAFNELSEKFNLDQPLKLETTKINKGIQTQKDYKNLLSVEEIEMIEIMYAREIKLLEYKF